MKNKKYKILALEPYYGGSHKSFLDHLSAMSEHEWTLLTLPPRKWKWRMTHSGVTFADEVAKLAEGADAVPDLIFCTDMLNLCEFKALAPARFANIPVIAYFHENQLGYPTEYSKSADRYFGWVNITTALAADAVWFNSEYHLNSFLDEIGARMKKAPDYRFSDFQEKIAAKATVVPQGIRDFPERCEVRKPGAIRILWAARWEFDKNPAEFFDAVRIVKEVGIDFRLSVIGGKPGPKDDVFQRAKSEFHPHIVHWGYLHSAEEYEKVLLEADIAVSTAIHEFFGIGMAEAAAAGCFPLVPHRLAYPEVFKENSDDLNKESFFYDGGAKELASKIAKLAEMIEHDASFWQGDPKRAIRKVQRFGWKNVIHLADDCTREFLA